LTTDRKGVVLVTGASSGIGRACALHLVREGYHVFGTTRRDPDLLRHDLGITDQLDVLVMDIDDDASVVRTISAIVAQTGRLDAIINSAGFGISGAVEETSDKEARAIIETNVLGMLRVCRAVLPTMRTQGSGVIVNISSIGGRIGLPFQGFYSATKFAIEGLTESLRMELRAFGIRAVLIEPGDCSTGFTDSRQRVEGAGLSDIYGHTREAVLTIVEKDERHGSSPDVVARLVVRVLNKRRPRVRYTVGPASQKLAAGLKRVLPSKIFEWILSMYYGVR
jgi:NAD(P)-dependent dehydrogenase (short-subunit alcohol dehydrogenase family)